MLGTLYVVATPIGNLEDVTLRALRVLREASVIAAEDTRRTAHLLQHYSISTRTTSLHAHNERAKTPALLARLASGESIALVSDAGTPCLSDPGAHLVAAAHAAGIRVEPIPGPCAAMALLSVAGLHGTEFVFLGFPPIRSRARKNVFLSFALEKRLLVLYEAPHRMEGTLRDMLEVFGDRTAAVGRELTKIYENLVVRPISWHLANLGVPRGEYAMVVSGLQSTSRSASDELPGNDALADEFGELTNTRGLSRRQAIKTLATKYSVSAREIFDRLEDGKRPDE